jgi:hypothetical protein
LLRTACRLYFPRAKASQRPNAALQTALLVKGAMRFLSSDLFHCSPRQCALDCASPKKDGPVSSSNARQHAIFYQRAQGSLRHVARFAQFSITIE